MIPTGLCQVASGGDAQLDAQMLKQDRHEIGKHDNGQERITELRAARQVGRPIAGVHVTYGHQKTRAGKGK